MVTLTLKQRNQIEAVLAIIEAAIDDAPSVKAKHKALTEATRAFRASDGMVGGEGPGNAMDRANDAWENEKLRVLDEIMAAIQRGTGLR